MSLGPTGARLWATYLLDEPGMMGSFEYIHKVNVPRLFGIEVEIDGRAVPVRCVDHRWFPSRLETTFLGGGVELGEAKFITWDDCAVDAIKLTNRSGTSKRVQLRMLLGAGPSSKADTPDWHFQTHGQTVYVHTAIHGTRSRSLADGESAVCIAVAALALSPGDAEDVAHRWSRMPDPLAQHEREYAAFFDGVPAFECSDPYYQAMWDYRWYLVRRNLADPRSGQLRHPLFYEGRSAKMSLTPWNPQGWEFSKLIPFGTPFHLLEARWHHDPAPCQGEILNLIRNQPEDSLFRCVCTDSRGGDYADFSVWAAWQLYLMHRDRDWLRSVATGLGRQVDGVLVVYDGDCDYLPTVYDHGKTGKEFQPSFFHAHGYPDNAPKSDASPLERVDAACYLHLNALGAAAAMRELGYNHEAARLAGIAGHVRQAVLARMWDTDRQFFYDLDGATHQRVPVENVVGFDPFFAGITGPEHSHAFDRLTDPDQFGAPWPVPSTTRRSAVYAPDASWKGEHLKGPHGCMWNGPTWPFTNSTVLMSLASAIRSGCRTLEPVFADLLSRYTRMCFRNGDANDPVIYEHYNPETGEPISQEEDYFHSTWIDLIMGHVAGVTPLANGGVEFHPIDAGLNEYHIRNARVASHTVEVHFDRDAGYSARVDGRVAEERKAI